MRKCYIYALRDNFKEKYVIPEEKRYVGKSITPSERIDDEIKEAKTGHICHRCRWIRKILKQNGEIQLVILEECTEETSDNLEIFWIAELRKQGHRLTNQTDGGTGGATNTGKKFSKEWRNKIGNGNKGKERTKEHRENYSTSTKKQWREQRELMTECARKNAEKKKGVKRPKEIGIKIGNSLRGVKHSKERKEANRQGQLNRKPITNIARENMRIAARKKLENPKYRENFKLSHQNIKRTEEWKKNLSNSITLWHAKRKLEKLKLLNSDLKNNSQINQ